MTNILRRISLTDGLLFGSLEATKKTPTPRSPYRTCYGRKIPTQHMIRLKGERHWRRVYVACFGNAGTAYVSVGNDWIVIED